MTHIKQSLLLALVAAFVVACEPPEAEVEATEDTVVAVEEVEQAAEPEEPVEKELNNAEISIAVDNALLLDDGVPAHRIDVTTAEGVVTLGGTVNSLLAKRRAAEVAQSIRGVRSVVNTIEVTPPQIADAKLRRDVNQALIADPATESYEVSVSVKDGRVTLSGQVDSWQEKQLAGTVAASVRGVTEVDNAIDINYPQERPAEEIEADIARRLEHDVWVDDALIDVEVKPETKEVVLSGTVGSARERERAFQDAWVAGAHAVDVDNLQVEWWARNRMRRDPSQGVTKSDEKLEQAVKEAFLYDPRLLSFKPQVEVEAGVATLTGTVGDLAAKRAAKQDALNTFGVWRVRNLLKVRTEEDISDDKVLTNVQDALALDPYVERHEVNPTVVNGQVFLYGTVDSELEREQAGRAAARAKGAAAVNNQIEVRAGLARVDDWALENDIEYQLWWDPFVYSDNVSVEVLDGTATLTGVVSDWKAYMEAIDSAYEAGAESVVTQLRVEEGPPDLIPTEEGQEAS